MRSLKNQQDRFYNNKPVIGIPSFNVLVTFIGIYALSWLIIFLIGFLFLAKAGQPIRTFSDFAIYSILPADAMSIFLRQFGVSSDLPLDKLLYAPIILLIPMICKFCLTTKKRRENWEKLFIPKITLLVTLAFSGFCTILVLFASMGIHFLLYIIYALSILFIISNLAMLAGIGFYIYAVRVYYPKDHCGIKPLKVA